MSAHKAISIRIRPEILARLREAVDKSGLSQTRIVEDSIQRHLGTVFKMAQILHDARKENSTDEKPTE